eukprot:1473615-Rhodomonas_salina.3
MRARCKPKLEKKYFSRVFISESLTTPTRVPGCAYSQTRLSRYRVLRHRKAAETRVAVSYTHLTLPTICSV